MLIAVPWVAMRWVQNHQLAQLFADYEAAETETVWPTIAASEGDRVRLACGEVTLPDGRAGRLTVPEGSMVGDRRRMPGQGYAEGDLDLEFELAEHTSLDEAQAEALARLRDLGL